MFFVVPRCQVVTSFSPKEPSYPPAALLFFQLGVLPINDRPYNAILTDPGRRPGKSLRRSSGNHAKLVYDLGNFSSRNPKSGIVAGSTQLATVRNPDVAGVHNENDWNMLTRDCCKNSKMPRFLLMPLTIFALILKCAVYHMPICKIVQ